MCLCIAEEQTTVNLTADSRDAGKVSADVDGEGRQKGFWPRGLFRYIRPPNGLPDCEQ